MSTVNVVWPNRHGADGTIARGYWDMGLIEGLFSGSVWRVPGGPEFVHHAKAGDVTEGEGAVVVVAARWHVDDAKWLVEQTQHLAWVLWILCGDEEGEFPWRDLSHPNQRVWVQTPYAHKHQGIARPFGDGWPPAAPDELAGMQAEADARPFDWFFAGQVNGQRRRSCAKTLRALPHDEAQLHTTEIFGSGLPYGEYLRRMASAKVVPCPAGLFTPDTFRLFEALEAGCVPIADAASDNCGDLGYWRWLFGTVPFPVVDDWSQLPGVLDEVLADWPALANRCSSWWQQQKRLMAWGLADDVRALSLGASMPPATAGADLVTALVPTSPIPSHPDTKVIEETIGSIRASLGDAEVIVMIDGARPEFADRRDAYAEYTRRLLWLCEHRWHNVVPLLHDDHLHQAEMTRRALEVVRTPCVLFVEHDTPLVGEVPWDRLAAVVQSGVANVVRFHHEDRVLDDHRHLMCDEGPSVVSGVPMWRTAQYSQRPHIAGTEFYREMLATYFGHGARTFIEDAMHGVVQTHWRAEGEGGWGRFKLWLYAPEGDMKRSTHLDGRGDDPKAGCVFAYDGPVPQYAPPGEHL